MNDFLPLKEAFIQNPHFLSFVRSPGMPTSNEISSAPGEQMFLIFGQLAVYKCIQNTVSQISGKMPRSEEILTNVNKS